MGDQLLPLSLTERTVHLCVDTQRIFSAEGPWPTMDGQGLARRSSAREPPSRENCFYPLHSARASRPDAGHVAALLRALARCDPRAPGFPAAGGDAAARALCPPATVIDKTAIPPSPNPGLIEHSRQRETAR
jgi:hypothetical protein